jgi:TRAP-type uncharacterized transport system fused permease subunit
MKQLLKMLAFAAGVQNWLFRKTTVFERWLLIVAGFALVYPKALFDYIGIALIVAVIVMQKLRKEEVHAAA